MEKKPFPVSASSCWKESRCRFPHSSSVPPGPIETDVTNSMLIPNSELFFSQKFFGQNFNFYFFSSRSPSNHMTFSLWTWRLRHSGTFLPLLRPIYAKMQFLADSWLEKVTNFLIQKLSASLSVYDRVGQGLALG